MTADAQRIKNAFERQHRLQTPHDETTKNFLEKLQEDIQKTKEAGMNAHLSKPIEQNLLFSTLANFIL